MKKKQVLLALTTAAGLGLTATYSAPQRKAAPFTTYLSACHHPILTS